MVMWSQSQNSFVFSGYSGFFSDKGHAKANIVSKENDIYNLFHNCKKQSLNLYEGIGF